MKPQLPLSSFERNIQSQHGEDGVIEEIFRRIGITHNSCIEFGAWDGKHYSNTWNLWHTNQWKALLIEGDPEKYKVLQAATSNFPNIQTVCSLVTGSGENSLENILSRSMEMSHVDLLSVDIDSDDYHVFEGLRELRPRIIIIEYNPTIPPHIEMIQSPGEYFGASALSFVKLAKTKAYCLAHVTTTNLIFVVEEEFQKLNFAELCLSDSFDTSNLVYVITAFDGRTLLSGPLTYKPYLRTLQSVSEVACGRKAALKRLVGFRPPKLAVAEPIRLNLDQQTISVEIFKTSE